MVSGLGAVFKWLWVRLSPTTTRLWGLGYLCWPVCSPQRLRGDPSAPLGPTGYHFRVKAFTLDTKYLEIVLGRTIVILHMTCETRKDGLVRCQLKFVQ